MRSSASAATNPKSSTPTLSKKIRAGAGTHFDPEIVDAFLKVQDDWRTMADTHRDRPDHAALRKESPDTCWLCRIRRIRRDTQALAFRLTEMSRSSYFDYSCIPTYSSHASSTRAKSCCPYGSQARPLSRAKGTKPRFARFFRRGNLMIDVTSQGRRLSIRSANCGILPAVPDHPLYTRASPSWPGILRRRSAVTSPETPAARSFRGARITLADQQKGYQFTATTDKKRTLSVQLQ